MWVLKKERKKQRKRDNPIGYKNISKNIDKFKDVDELLINLVGKINAAKLYDNLLMLIFFP